MFLNSPCPMIGRTESFLKNAVLGCYAVWLLEELTFRMNLAPPSSRGQESVNLVFLCSMCQLLVMANVPSSLILITLVMEALGSSKTSILKRPHGVTSQRTAFFIVIL
jgi:hypothetical protein